MKEDKFSWVETHKQLVQYLSTKQNSQKELIQILKSIGIGPFNDKSDIGDHYIELEEIDPFTFFCYIYKYGTKRRLEFLSKIAETLHLSIPKGDSGIPSAQPQKVWLFPYKFERKKDEINRLWSFFYKCISDNITESDFEDILQIQSIGKTKLTESLFYINPEKYLPINGPLKPYINEVLNFSPDFNTYSEYIALLENIKIKSTLPFYELSYEAWQWNKNRKNVNYWIFQGNPKIFDFESALRNEILNDWSVSAYKGKIQIGDKVIIWISGNKSGCYALAEVSSEPHKRTKSLDDHLWNEEEKKSELKVGIKIIHNLVEHPIMKNDISSIKELSKLKVGNQGTNFTATAEEYKTLLALSKNSGPKYWLYAPGANADMWEEFYSLGIMGLGWDELGNLEQYPDKVSLVKELQEINNTSSTYKNDATANYEFKDLISIGDIIIVKKGRSELLGYGIVTSDYFYDESRSIYKSCRKIEWKKKGVWKTDHSLALKTLTEITKYSGYAEKLLYLIDGKNTGTLIDFYEQIEKFIIQAQTNDLKTSSNNYLQSYRGLDVKISFGQGTASKIPWISFLRSGQTTSNGIYPVYLYFKSENLLVLAYGVSVTNSPENIWNLPGLLSISDYYSENHLGGPSNYGNSYVYKVYNVNKLPDASIMNKDLDDLLTYYNDLDFSDNQSINSINMQFDYDVFNNISKDAGLIFSPLLIKRFIASLCTKPFLICSGLSGSGKTKLAQAFAQWISADESQYAIVPVGADWTNREPLLGYPNALNKEEYISPENGVLDLMIRAKQNIENSDEPTIPYFLILDEMNLSHVERYFADFLSTMESGDKIPLHKIENDSLIVPPSIKLPKNLFIIGTVNIDETTYMFSPKVLDRANTIEFRLTESDLEDFITSDIKLDMDLLKSQGANMSESFMSIALQESDKNLKPVAADLKLFFSELKKSGAEFGYRTAGEIGRLMYMLKELGETGDTLLDIAIMQKLLPKLHGSRNKLTKVLPILGGFCLSDSSRIKEDYLDKFMSNYLTEDELKSDMNIKYKISFEKICRMYKNAIENGFASYAEA